MKIVWSSTIKVNNRHNNGNSTINVYGYNMRHMTKRQSLFSNVSAWENVFNKLSFNWTKNSVWMKGQKVNSTLDLYKRLTWRHMLVDELNQLHSNYINLSTNHSETSSFILKVVTSSWVSPSVSDSGLNNVRLNTVTDNPHFGCVRFSSFVVVEQPKHELLK